MHGVVGVLDHDIRVVLDESVRVSRRRGCRQRETDFSGEVRDLRRAAKIKELLEALVDWTRRLKKARA